MKEENLDSIFENLKGTWDTQEPTSGHELRFLSKLEVKNKVVTIPQKKTNWLKPLAIAASIAVLVAVGFGVLNSNPTVEEQVAEISPEVANTQFYFANIIEEQIKTLEKEDTPETKKLVADTMLQLQKLATNYKTLEKDLINGGNSKLILSAMITNFQTRIDLLEDVMNKIEELKTLNINTHENNTI